MNDDYSRKMDALVMTNSLGRYRENGLRQLLPAERTDYLETGFGADARREKDI